MWGPRPAGPHNRQGGERAPRPPPLGTSLITLLAIFGTKLVWVFRPRPLDLVREIGEGCKITVLRQSFSTEGHFPLFLPPPRNLPILSPHFCRDIQRNYGSSDASCHGIQQDPRCRKKCLEPRGLIYIGRIFTSIHQHTSGTVYTPAMEGINLDQSSRRPVANRGLDPSTWVTACIQDFQRCRP